MMINVKPARGGGGGGTPGICGAFGFFEEFLIKTPTLGSKKWFNSGQTPYPGDKLYRISEYLAGICEFYYTLGTLKCRLCLKYVVCSCL